MGVEGWGREVAEKAVPMYTGGVRSEGCRLPVMSDVHPGLSQTGRKCRRLMQRTGKDFKEIHGCLLCK